METQGTPPSFFNEVNNTKIKNQHNKRKLQAIAPYIHRYEKPQFTTSKLNAGI